jgi:hypothetical protein
MAANPSKSPQTSPCRPAAHGQLRLRWAPCRKVKPGQDALLVIPPLRLSEPLLYYYTILDPGVLHPFISPHPSIYPLISSSADSFFVFLFLNYHTPLSLTINCFLFNNSLNNTSKPHHTVNMKYQLIALPALAATVAAQDLYVRSHESITSQRRFTDSHSQQLHPRRAPDCPPQLSRR